MESVKISPKKCKIAMALAGHHRPVLLRLKRQGRTAYLRGFWNRTQTY